MLFEQSFFGVVSIAQSVEVTDSAVLGGVVEVVSSISAVGIRFVLLILLFSFHAYTLLPSSCYDRSILSSSEHLIALLLSGDFVSGVFLGLYCLILVLSVLSPL